MLAGSDGQHVVGFGDLNIDIFLEVQNKRYSQILYLIDYVAPGLHFWKNNSISMEISQNQKNPGSLTSTQQTIIEHRSILIEH